MGGRWSIGLSFSSSRRRGRRSATRRTAEATTAALRRLTMGEARHVEESSKPRTSASVQSASVSSVSGPSNTTTYDNSYDSRPPSWYNTEADECNDVAAPYEALSPPATHTVTIPAATALAATVFMGEVSMATVSTSTYPMDYSQQQKQRQQQQQQPQEQQKQQQQLTQQEQPQQQQQQQQQRQKRQKQHQEQQQQQQQEEQEEQLCAMYAEVVPRSFAPAPYTTALHDPPHAVPSFETVPWGQHHQDHPPQLFSNAQPVVGYCDPAPYATVHIPLDSIPPVARIPVGAYYDQHQHQQPPPPFPNIQPAIWFPATYAPALWDYSHCEPHQYQQQPPQPCMSYVQQPVAECHSPRPYTTAAQDHHHFHHHCHHHHRPRHANPPGGDVSGTIPGTFPGNFPGNFPGKSPRNNSGTVPGRISEINPGRLTGNVLPSAPVLLSTPVLRNAYDSEDDEEHLNSNAAQ